MILLCLLTMGCERKAERFDLSGTVTYGGKPVSAGYILFSPDASTGNSGPGASADIHDGEFQTSVGSGTIGGRHVVTIAGFDGQSYTVNGLAKPMGKPVVHTTMTVDLPKQNGTYDFAASSSRQ